MNLRTKTAGCRGFARAAHAARADPCVLAAEVLRKLRRSLGDEQPTQNWYGQGVSDYLIKTQHCDGLKG